MEFKVWVDGIQRVISGVNSETTCRDIVLCLAQATHQFGKFVLIEKWRNNERLLAPNESPLQLLNKWADYGNEVCFIMRRSDYHQQIQQQHLQQQQHQPKLQHVQAIPSSNSAPAISSIQANTQSGFAQQVHSTQMHPAHSTVTGQQMQQHLQSPNAANLRRSPGHVYGYTGSAHSGLNGAHSPMQQTNKYIPVNSRNNSHFVATPRSVSATHVAPTLAVNGNDSSDESNLYRPKRPPPYTVAIAKSTLMQNGNSTKPSHSSAFYQQQKQHPMSTGYTDQVYGEIGIPPVLSNRNLNGNEDNGKNQIYDTRVNPDLANKQLIDERIKKKHAGGVDGGQHNTIPVAHSELQNNFISNRSQRSWNDKEVAKLTAREQFVINDELELLQREKERIEIEKNQLNFNLNETDSKIAKCRQRIQKLMDDIKEVSAAKENERIKREEEHAKEQLEELRQQINQSLQDYEKASEELNSIQEEMDKLDSDLSERKKKIEKLTADIKEANLEGLTLLPMEEQILGCTHLDDENNPPLDHGHESRLNVRLGSTRRISGCPRELGNAAPTTKNPNGVWV